MKTKSKCSPKMMAHLKRVHALVRARTAERKAKALKSAERKAKALKSAEAKRIKARARYAAKKAAK